MANATDDARRGSLELRIMEQLQQVDEGTLRNIDAWLRQGDPAEVRSRGMSRRQFIAASLLGTAGLAAAAGGGAALNRGRQAVSGVAATAQDIGDIGDTVAQWQSYADGLTNQLSETAGVLDLYDQMDRVGLDDVVGRGLTAVAAVLGRIAQGAATLREGLAGAKARVNQFDQGLAVIDGGLARTEATVSRISDLFQALEDRLKDASQPVKPVTEALGGFFTALISKIPLGVGDSILETISRIQALISAIPESIENINRDLIEPLRLHFFPRDAEGQVEVRLIDPLTNLLFLPAEGILTALQELGTTWKDELEQPTRERLATRDTLRKEIERRRSQLAPLPGEAPK